MSKILPLMFAVLAVPAGAQNPSPFRYFVSGLKKDALDPAQQKARESELRGAQVRAAQEQNELLRQLQKQYGKSEEAWPAVALQQFDEMDRKTWAAKREQAMASVAQQGIDDSVADLKRRFQQLAEKAPAGAIQLTDSRDDATVAIEVLGRMMDGNSATLFYKLTPVRWLTPAELAALTVRRVGNYKYATSAMVPETSYSEATPYWTIAVWQVVQGPHYSEGAETAAELIVELATGHQDYFRHKDPKPPKKPGS